MAPAEIAARKGVLASMTSVRCVQLTKIEPGIVYDGEVLFVENIKNGIRKDVS